MEGLANLGAAITTLTSTWERPLEADLSGEFARYTIMQNFNGTPYPHFMVFRKSEGHW